jgi:hypothetical protein
MIVPSVPVMQRLWNDTKGLTIGKKTGKKGRKRIKLMDAQSIKDLPVGGEFFYWWFGGGNESEFSVNL